MKNLKLFELSPRVLWLLLACIVVGTACFGWLGYKWRHTVPLRTVVIAGNTHVSSAALNERVGIGGDTLLFDVNPADVVDRLLQDPWVGLATVRRRPTGTLAVRVVERTPVAMLMRKGRPALYLDRYGSAMPVTSGHPVDVPILQDGGGLVALRAGQRAEEPKLLEMLDVLGGLDDPASLLISEVEIGPTGLVLFTTPLPDGPSVRVELGAFNYAEKLNRLAAFWGQVVLDRSRAGATEIRKIDLRYDGQIITS